jgi:signal transduction histidine kinase
MHKKLTALIHWFIPEEIKADIEDLRRAHGIVIITAILIPWWPLFAAGYYSLHAPTPLIALVFAGGPCALLAPMILKKTKSILLAANTLAAVIFISLTAIAYFDGGLYSQAIPSMVGIPLVAVLLGSARSGLAWLGACVIALSSFHFLEISGHSFARLVSPAGEERLWFVGILCAIINITWIGAYYEKIRNELYETAKKRAQDLESKNNLILDQQQQLSHASKVGALGEMASGIAHEINTPLSVIQIRAEQLTELTAEEPLNRALIADISVNIANTVGRIAKIVQGLRNFSRKAGDDPFVATAISEIIKDTLVLCQERFRHNQIDFRHGAVPDAKIMCRPAQISQVLLNLLNNASDAICPLSVNPKWIELNVKVEGANVHITVSDCGTGIPTQVRDKIFDPYFTTKEVGKGTGLGLSVSKGILEMHNGKLGIDDNAANTTFVITLPKAAEPAHSARQAG